jgi:hypothetical protein
MAAISGHSFNIGPYLEFVLEHHLCGEQQPPNIWYRNPEKKGKNIDEKQSIVFRCNTSLHSDKLV